MAGYRGQLGCAVAPGGFTRRHGAVARRADPHWALLPLPRSSCLLQESTWLWEGCGSTVSAGQPQVLVVLSGEKLGGRRGQHAGGKHGGGFSDALCLRCVEMYPNASPFCLDVAWALENQEKVRRLRGALRIPKCWRLLRVPGLGAGEGFALRGSVCYGHKPKRK